MYVYPKQERGIVWGKFGGMSDVTDLIDEKSKLKMSDGIVFQKVKLFSQNFFFLFLFLSQNLFFSLCSSPPHTPLPHKNLLYPSHDVYPDDYGSDCVDDDDCC